MPMDPLIEVSTVGGKNMRETCARVLAAALMTGAIAGVVGLAAHLGSPNEPGRPIAVPPSSLQRTVRLTAQPVPKPRRSVARLVTTHTTRIQTRSVVTTRSLAFVRRHRSKRGAPRELAATSTAAPTPPPAADPAPPATPAPDAGDLGHGRGHGHAYGRGQQDD